MGLLVGTCGWQYDDWRGLLYSPGAPKSGWLSLYAQEFPTVEVDNSFYRLPSRETFERWREATPDGFVVAVKASRFLTHVKRLRDPAEPVARLMAVADGLGPRLGPVLLQLPPTMQVDVDRLDECLACFPSGVRVAVEPRHPSWWVPEVRDVLTARGAALVWSDRRGRPVAPLWRTTSWGYLRLHEGTANPPPSYGDRALRTWLGRLRDTWPASSDAFVFFNNDPGGAAVRNARRLQMLHDRAA